MSSGITVVIKGPRQIGKSSLLNRLMDAARAVGKQTVLMDFQMLKSALESPDNFYRQFCALLSYTLGVEDKVDEFWQLPLTNPFRCTEYVYRHLMKITFGPLFLCIDEVDSVFAAPFRGDFFGMLRAWHNKRAFDPGWQKLDLVLVTSTEPYLFIEDLNQSPFNVGEIIQLKPFSHEQVQELNRRFRTPMEASQIEALYSLLEGHPFLTHRALYLLAAGRISSHELFETATSLEGPFGDHLRSILLRLHTRPGMIHALRQILDDGVCEDEISFFRLHGAGLIRRDGVGVSIASLFYRKFFNQVLNV